MKIVGIVCEYDPFHKGHQRQFSLIRQLHPEAYIVCLMSGCFTQRGMPALHLPQFRARAALNAGCDLVLELPAAFSLRDAEHFAYGAVSILHALQFVTHLSFGTEDSFELLQPVVELLSRQNNTPLPGLRDGLSYPAALEDFLSHQLPQCREVISRPNNILAIQYCLALLKLKSPILPLPVLRQGEYHDERLNKDSCPSATAIRKAFLEGRNDDAETAAGYPLPTKPICHPAALDTALLYRIRNMLPEEIAAYPCCTEGLENRILTCAKTATSREELLRQLKTRRYPYTRLSRIMSQILLQMPENLLNSFPEAPYVRLLGLRKEAKPLLSQLQYSRIPVIAKAADGDVDHPLYQLDIRSYDLWALGAGLPSGLMFKQSPVIF